MSELDSALSASIDVRDMAVSYGPTISSAYQNLSKDKYNYMFWFKLAINWGLLNYLSWSREGGAIF